VGDFLAWLFLHPDDEYSVTDLANRFRVSAATVSREADRLVSGELIHQVRRGNLRLLRANVHSVLAGPLTDLLALSHGPVAVLGELLGAVDGVTEAYIYGSWAARYRGEPGPIPRDVDVLAVGEADEDDLFAAARSAERILGREVNIHRVSPPAWSDPGEDPFLRTVHVRPLVGLSLG
jgi:DNA-binding transcriptional ArsR family regulator